MPNLKMLWLPAEGTLLALSLERILRQSPRGELLKVSCSCEFQPSQRQIAVLPRLDMELCRRLRAGEGRPKVLAAALDEREARLALDADVDGVVDLDHAIDELPEAVEALASDRRWLSPSFACRMGVRIQSTGR